jgi:hypothetical protein
VQVYRQPWAGSVGLQHTVQARVERQWVGTKVVDGGEPKGCASRDLDRRAEVISPAVAPRRRCP